METEKKPCPFCGQEINLELQKCPFCEEKLVKPKKTGFCKKIKNILAEIFNIFNNTNSKSLKNIICLIFLILLILSFTNKYKIEAVGSDTYRINQITGDVKLISGKNIIDTEVVHNISKFERNKLSKFTILRKQFIPGKNITCSLKIFWRDDVLYYRLNLSPYNDTLKKIIEGPYYDNYNKNVEILLKDKNNFSILNKSINIRNMTRIVDENNTPNSLETEGRVDLSYKDMKLIEDWDIHWNL